MGKYNEWTKFNEFYLHNFDEHRKIIGQLVPLSFNSTSGIFSLTEAEQGLKFGQNFLLLCRSQMNNTQIILQVKVIKVKGPQITFLYLKCIEQNEIQAQEDRYPYYYLPQGGPVPTLWGTHPWFLSEKIFGFIVGVHGQSIKVRFKLDRLSIMPSMELDFYLNFPGEKERSFRFKILRGHTTDHFFIAELEVIKKHRELAFFLGKSVALTYSDYDFDKFKEAGLILPNLRWAIHVELVTTEESTRQCLELRKTAYTRKLTSKLSGVEEIEQFKDQFDAHSILMLIKLGAKPIGTGRILFNNGDLSKSEIARLTNLSKLFLDGGYVEASRFATHHDYRGRDVFLLMLYLTFKLSLLAQYRYILIDCEDHLLPVYKKLGGKELGVRFPHPLEGVILNLIQFDLEGLILGKGVRFLTWLVVITPLLKHLNEAGLLQLNPYRRFLVSIGCGISALQEFKLNLQRRM